nr:MAG TPA: hypothetical protein [Caudoviricetes sp.]
MDYRKLVIQILTRRNRLLIKPYQFDAVFVLPWSMA